jgi:hypothetical protein
VAMAAQETHYVSMAQVVEPSSQNSIVTWESKKLWSTVASQVRIAPSVRMTGYHHQQLGEARMWVNLIRITVPAVTGNDTPVYHDHFMGLTFGDLMKRVLVGGILPLLNTISRFFLISGTSSSGLLSTFP